MTTSNPPAVREEYLTRAQARRHRALWARAGELVAQGYKLLPPSDGDLRLTSPSGEVVNLSEENP
jgi:hypothetical protein